MEVRRGVENQFTLPLHFLSRCRMRAASSRAATDLLLVRTEALRKELHLTERRSALTADFVRTYQLTEKEEAQLNSPHSAAAELELEPLLAALERVHSIHKAAQVRWRVVRACVRASAV